MNALAAMILGMVLATTLPPAPACTTTCAHVNFLLFDAETGAAVPYDLGIQRSRPILWRATFGLGCDQSYCPGFGGHLSMQMPYLQEPTLLAGYPGLPDVPLFGGIYGPRSIDGPTYTAGHGGLWWSAVGDAWYITASMNWSEGCYQTPWGFLCGGSYAHPQADVRILPDNWVPTAWNAGRGGDVTYDGCTGVGDLALVLSRWGALNTTNICDFNNDLRVDVDDLLMVITHWTTTCK